MICAFRSLAAASAASALALAAASGAAAQDDAPAFETTDLGGGLYRIANDRAGNVGLSVTGESVLMIDTQMESFAEALEAAVMEASGDRAPDRVINTHFHADHTRGNAHFADLGARIYAHENVRPRLEDMTRPDDEPLTDAYFPVETVSDGAFEGAGRTVELHHAPDAHTDGDVFIHFPDDDVIHAGDLLFSGRYPFIDLDNGGTVDGYIAALDQVLEVAGPDTQVIAGHGPLSGEDELEASRDMLITAQAAVQGLVDQGLSLEEIQSAGPLSGFDEDWSWGFIDTERMTETLYRDIAGEDE